MSARDSNDSSWSKRKSMLSLASLRSGTSDHQRLDDTLGMSSKHTKTLTKKDKHVRTSSLLTDLDKLDMVRDDHVNTMPHSAAPLKTSSTRPSLNMKITKRPPSVFEALKNTVRASGEELGSGTYANGEPLSSTSSKAPSLSFESAIEGTASARSVLMHGEVQTSSGMFRKKKEYLVLTDSQIIRYKSQQRAAETFKNIPYTSGRIPMVKHGSMASVGSQSDLQTMSDSSGDKDGRVPLRQVVASHKLDDGKPYFAMEVCYLDEESGQASAMTLQFGNPEERDVWLQQIRTAVFHTRSRETTYISEYNLENAARIVERDNDYDPANCAIFKVVQRQPTAKSVNRSSSDDLTKVASTVLFLAIGVHKVHLIQLVKPVARSSSPALASPTQAQTSHAILTLSAVKVSGFDDAFELTFRLPLRKGKTLYLASSTSYEIVSRLALLENFLRPECGHRLFRLSAPPEVEDLLAPPAASDVEEHSCLDRTLTAYCVAYGVNPANIRYTVNYTCEDAPRFELLPPSESRRPSYGPLELLAILRALRYNESFGTLCFMDISLDSLNGLHDNYGQELVCTRTKRGTPIRLTPEELNRSSLLVQEVRALAATSKRLRRMDFSNCVSAKHTAPDPSDDEPSRTREIGCGIVEALFPLCKHQTTNVDWICLNGIELSDTDLDYLVGAAVDKSCHFRAIELNLCGLTDRSLGLILDALRVQENTLESLEIAGNGARISPATFDSQLSMFGFLRKLNLSNASITSGSEPFIQAETLLIWRLQELRLSGTSLNSATIDAISTYLAHPQSNSLHELYLNNTHLSGNDVATILHSLCRVKGEIRDLHLDISQCILSKGLEKVARAIQEGKTPSHISMRAVEYREESHFRKIIGAMTVNKTVKFMDMSQAALPGDASDETCMMVSTLLADNTTLIELDLSGDDSRLATSKFGAGINDALGGLKQNRTLQIFRIEKQKLGFQGASTLAEVLRENRTLLELHCDNNEIPLHGLTDLVNSLVNNTTLVFLPPMNDGRAAAFKAAEATMKVMADVEAPGSHASQLKTGTFSGVSAVRRGFSNVKNSAKRTTSIHSPSFPNFSSASHAPSPPGTRTSSPLSLSLPPIRSKQSQHSPTSSISMGNSAFTVQDIQTTHRLLSEQWDRQCYRLEQYLNRNWCLLNSVACNMEVEDEKFERPSSVGSLGKMLQRVKDDTTPRAEKQQYFDSPQDQPQIAVCSPLQKSTSIDGEKHPVSFKHFILESDSQAPDSPESDLDIDGNMRQFHPDENSEGIKGPGTPTQKKAFPLA